MDTHLHTPGWFSLENPKTGSTKIIESINRNTGLAADRKCFSLLLFQISKFLRKKKWVKDLDQSLTTLPAGRIRFSSAAPVHSPLQRSNCFHPLTYMPWNLVSPSPSPLLLQLPALNLFLSLRKNLTFPCTSVVGLTVWPPIP